ncbi:hypothetical protein BC826DRAFT_735709 [Russula brevipes]|nr:hypothetical protein BC826DRAFT_735709 [Russula brevipes]
MRRQTWRPAAARLHCTVVAMFTTAPCQTDGLGSEARTCNRAVAAALVLVVERCLRQGRFGHCNEIDGCTGAMMSVRCRRLAFYWMGRKSMSPKGVSVPKLRTQVHLLRLNRIPSVI